MITVQFKKLEEDSTVPTNAYGNDAGWDLYSNYDYEIPVGHFVDIRTGIAVAIPEGYYGRIVHRSSSPRKRGLICFEGIIDAGFRGELFACAWAFPQWVSTEDSGLGHMRRFAPLGEWSPEFDNEIATVRRGEAVAQLIIQKVDPVQFTEVKELPPSLRGERGFGSSGN
jgi:deoxyuridine 5'-triphosphate nucleotidohydrolase